MKVQNLYTMIGEHKTILLVYTLIKKNMKRLKMNWKIHQQKKMKLIKT